MPLQQCHGLIAHYFERAHFPASSCSCKQFFFWLMPVQHDFETMTEIGLKTWRWWNSCCLLLHGTHITKRTSLRQNKPLTLMRILCIPITVSEYVVGNLYCNICSPQNWVIGEQWLSLTDADVVSFCLIFWKFTSRKQWPLNIKIRMLPLSLPSPFSCCPGTGCHWAPLRARPASGSVTMATRRKSRCSTWEGCTQPLLWTLRGEEKKPIHCETVAFRNIFLPLRAIKKEWAF